MNDKDNSSSEADPKIVVDDDWKSQVEKEKEQLQAQMESAAEQSGQPQLPEASFPMLVTTLASQAMVALGVVPDPMTNQANQDKALAKHVIDMIAMLEEKTKGNLSKDEEAYVSDTLHQLRMAFVTVPDQAPAPEEKKPTIELP